MKPREEGGVVDTQLNVYGVKGLKVVDMSIAPGNVGAVSVFLFMYVILKINTGPMNLLEHVLDRPHYWREGCLDNCLRIGDQWRVTMYSSWIVLKSGIDAMRPIETFFG